MMRLVFLKDPFDCCVENGLREWNMEVGIITS